MSKVFISVGHGGADPGGVANGIKEKDFNLVTSLKVREELERHGVIVLMSRETDENDTTKVAECNQFKPDLAIDIHYNIGKGDGAEAYYHYGGGLSKVLADNILSEIVSIGQNSRGAKIKKNKYGTDYYAFIRNTAAPAVIIENGFLDNKTDLEAFDTEAEQQNFGVAIAKGALKTLGITYIEEQKADQKKLYRVQVGAYSVKANAEKMAAKLKEKGFEAIIV